MELLKQLSIEEKARAYDEALKEAVVAHKDEDRHLKATLERIFPKLKESEDERIRKEIITLLKDIEEDDDYCGTKCIKDYIAWLEKQGEKPIGIRSRHATGKLAEIIKNIESSDKVEPKFHEGDWITNGATNPAQISSIKDGMYFTHDDTIGGDVESIDKEYHLWTIQDAKDGDVLAFNNDTIIIFKDLYNSSTFHSYCHIEDGVFNISENDMPDWWEGEGFKPATKEQREILFQKMHEAGYEWDTEKKEPKKIEQKPTKNIVEIWKDMRVEVYQQASGNRHEPNYSDDTTKMFSLNDIDEIIEKMSEQKPTDEEMKEALRTEYEKGRADTIAEMQKEWSEEDELSLKQAIYVCHQNGYTAVENWLKSLKQRIGG